MPVEDLFLYVNVGKSNALNILSIPIGVQASPVSQYVGLVCFGEDPKVLSRCCMDYSNLKQMISEYYQHFMINSMVIE